jgi:hypothetical protein
MKWKKRVGETSSVIRASSDLSTIELYDFELLFRLVI